MSYLKRLKKNTNKLTHYRVLSTTPLSRLIIIIIINILINKHTIFKNIHCFTRILSEYNALSEFNRNIWVSNWTAERFKIIILTEFLPLCKNLQFFRLFHLFLFFIQLSILWFSLFIKFFFFFFNYTLIITKKFVQALPFSLIVKYLNK